MLDLAAEPTGLFLSHRGVAGRSARRRGTARRGWPSGEGLPLPDRAREPSGMRLAIARRQLGRIEGLIEAPRACPALEYPGEIQKWEAVGPPFRIPTIHFMVFPKLALMGLTSGKVLARTCRVFTPCLIFNDPEVDTRSRIAPIDELLTGYPWSFEEGPLEYPMPGCVASAPRWQDWRSSRPRPSLFPDKGALRSRLYANSPSEDQRLDLGHPPRLQPGDARGI